ncbi:MAG: TonB-dependent receptor plug domain-containing protein [Nitrospinales bacterium]
MNTKPHYSPILILLAILFFLHPAVLFASDLVKLDPIEVKASRSDLSAKNLPASVTVISREQIKRSQHVQVEDILRQTLGADVVQNGPMGSLTSVFLRGAGSSSTLVMIDGIQVNLNTSGAFNFGNLTLDNIERIEILRGAQSTLWGADAVGGVINIITKTGKGTPSHFASFEGGSFSTFKETLGSSGTLGDSNYSFTASRIDSGGFSAANEKNGNTENDGYEATNLSGRLGHNFLGDGRIEFVGRYTKSRLDFDKFDFSANPPFVDGPNHSNNEQFYIAVPIQKSLAEWWDMRLNLNTSYDKAESIDESSVASHNFNRTYTADLQNNLKLGEFFSTVVGMEFQSLNGHNVEQGLNRNIDQQGYFLQTQFNYQDRFILTGGFRENLNSVFKDKLTYKFEGAYRFIESGTRIRAVGATGFRAPTINDLFFPNFSNPNLQPEESKNWEVGIDQTLFGGRLTFGITWFDSHFKNLIQFDSQTFRPENVGRARSNGLESFLNFQFTDNLDMSLNHTWNQAVDGDGARLRRRAKQKLNATLHHNWRNKLDSQVSLSYKSAIRDGVVGAAGFTTVRAVLSYQLLENLKLTARGENLFDDAHEEIPGFGTAGVSGYAGLTYNF